MSHIDFSKIVTAKDRMIEQNDAKRLAALATLNATDWAIIRVIETGKAVPPDIVKIRAEARLVVEE